MPKKKVEKEATESNQPMTRKEIAAALARKKTKQGAVDRAAKKAVKKNAKKAMPAN